jgi:hypothetical protein
MGLDRLGDPAQGQGAARRRGPPVELPVRVDAHRDLPDGRTRRALAGECRRVTGASTDDQPVVLR